MKNYNFTALWNKDPDAFEENERTTFLKMFDQLFFNGTFKQSGRTKEVDQPNRGRRTCWARTTPLDPRNLRKRLERKRENIGGNLRTFLFSLQGSMPQNTYPHLVEDTKADEVYFFFEEQVLRELGVEVFDLAINPREVYFLSQMEPYVHYLPEPMFRENCELTPHISDGQKVVESIASFFPPTGLWTIT